MKRKLLIEDIIEPRPSNRKRSPFATTHPEIADQWHYEMNCGFGPDDFSAGSTVYAWWCCPVDPSHVWQAEIHNRTGAMQRCPFCCRRRLAPDNCLATVHPKIAKQWHSKRNEKIRPSDVTAGAHKSFWWKCDKCGHEWETDVSSRTTQNSGCRKCSLKPRSLLCRKYRYALKYFDPEKNKDINPDWVSKSVPVQWQCNKGEDHVWLEPFNTRIPKEKFCPFCNNRKPFITNSLATQDPELAKQWHPTKNGKLTPDIVTANSKKRVWWQCSSCSKSWQALVQNRFTGRTGCPQCYARRRSDIAIETGFKKRVDKRIVTKIKTMYKQNAPLKQIAVELGVGLNTIQRVLKREGIEKRQGRCYDPEHAAKAAEAGLKLRIDTKIVKRIISLYQKGIPQSHIAVKLGVGENTVLRVLKLEGVHQSSK